MEAVEYLKSDRDPEVAALRQSNVNVMYRDAKGNPFIIEIQCAVAYACYAHLTQKTGNGGYGMMKPAILFPIMKRTPFKDPKEYSSHHRVTDLYTGENEIDNLSFSFRELSRSKKITIGELETNIERWAYFFQERAIDFSGRYGTPCEGRQAFLEGLRSAGGVQIHFGRVAGIPALRDEKGRDKCASPRRQK